MLFLASSLDDFHSFEVCKVAILRFFKKCEYPGLFYKCVVLNRIVVFYRRMAILTVRRLISTINQSHGPGQQIIVWRYQCSI